MYVCMFIYTNFFLKYTNKQMDKYIFVNIFAIFLYIFENVFKKYRYIF